MANDRYKFANPPAANPSQTLTIALGIDRFPFLYRGKTISITKVDLYLSFKDIHDSKTYTQDPANPTPSGDYAKGTPLTVYLTPAPGTAAPAAATLQSAAGFMNGMPHVSVDLSNSPGSLGSWLLEARDADIKKIAATLQTPVTASGTNHYRLKSELIDDIILVCAYNAS